jgi:hypothetical protein
MKASNSENELYLFRKVGLVDNYIYLYKFVIHNYLLE